MAPSPQSCLIAPDEGSHWVAIYGASEFVLSDNAEAFNAAHLLGKMKALGVKNTLSSPHHPQGDGICKRFYQILKEMVSALTATTTRTFQEEVACALFTYKSTPHLAAGETPCRLWRPLPPSCCPPCKTGIVASTLVTLLQKNADCVFYSFTVISRLTQLFR